MTTAERLLEEALALSSHERAWLLDRLTASVDDGAMPPLTPAWEAELNRRVEEMDAGTAEYVDWDDAKRAIFGPRS